MVQALLDLDIESTGTVCNLDAPRWAAGGIANGKRISGWRIGS